VIETHEHKGDFKERQPITALPPWEGVWLHFPCEILQPESSLAIADRLSSPAQPTYHECSEQSYQHFHCLCFTSLSVYTPHWQKDSNHDDALAPNNTYVVSVGEFNGVSREETVQQTARGQKLNGDLNLARCYESARPPMTASPHR
jgi:hypothetical protein